jgi:hypothetical protein
MLGDLLTAGKLQDDNANADDLVKWAKKNIRREQEVLPLQPDSWIRASGIGWMCPREEVLCARHGVVRKEVVGPDTMWTYDVGTGMHWVMQNLVLGPRGLITGCWRCRACGAEQGGYEDHKLLAYPEHCPACEDPVLGFEYVEMRVADEELRVHGHVDGFHPNGDDTWEFKTSNSYAMKAIKSGVIWPAYVEQADTYMEMSDRKRTRMVFIDKDKTTIAQAWHQVILPRSKSRWTAVRRKVLVLREGLSGGKLPGKVCATKTCNRAEGCSVVKQCFA